jgi:type II secretory pathway pseudopilin PulG
MHRDFNSESGVTLVEVLIAMCVLTVGAIGMASVFLYGIQAASSSPNELAATQKAAEAIESVFSARDSHTLEWDEIQNKVTGGPGIFVAGQTDMYVAGVDGILQTLDDGAPANPGDDKVVESWELPGPDGNLATPADNVTVELAGFKREVIITGLTDNLREIKVVISYPAGSTTRTYTLTALISAFA